MKKTIVICAVLLTASFLFACQPAQFFPADGIWYCPELKMRLDFQDETNCLFIYNGEEIVCGLGYDRGSSRLTVGCQDSNTTYFLLGEEVFGAEFISLEDDVLVLCENISGKEYCFRRIQ